MKTSDLFLLSAQIWFAACTIGHWPNCGIALFWGFICGALAVVTMHRENRSERLIYEQNE